ncbi:MAG: hypothetical protein BLITH_0322 [Brockia lithotrophica]|uniref:Uncharacterized protein n=1 Tax=Brockia lithotrophica TaxID=933949 RepID=A0A2T5GAN3_9BACL|nr:hypothetical protein [Brockia lithotrophica]PTQ53242.1 MAG: hypothetical protein BLITH_0322 [Brockia lithotrophica]
MKWWKAPRGANRGTSRIFRRWRAIREKARREARKAGGYALVLVLIVFLLFSFLGTALLELTVLSAHAGKKSDTFLRAQSRVEDAAVNFEARLAKELKTLPPAPGGGTGENQIRQAVDRALQSMPQDPNFEAELEKLESTLDTGVAYSGVLTMKFTGRDALGSERAVRRTYAVSNLPFAYAVASQGEVVLNGAPFIQGDIAAKGPLHVNKEAKWHGCSLEQNNLIGFLLCLIDHYILGTGCTFEAGYPAMQRTDGSAALISLEKKDLYIDGNRYDFTDANLARAFAHTNTIPAPQASAVTKQIFSIDVGALVDKKAKEAEAWRQQILSCMNDPKNRGNLKHGTESYDRYYKGQGSIPVLIGVTRGEMDCGNERIYLYYVESGLLPSRLVINMNHTDPVGSGGMGRTVVYINRDLTISAEFFPVVYSVHGDLIVDGDLTLKCSEDGRCPRLKTTGNVYVTGKVDIEGGNLDIGRDANSWMVVRKSPEGIFQKLGWLIGDLVTFLTGLYDKTPKIRNAEMYWGNLYINDSVHIQNSFLGSATNKQSANPVAVYVKGDAYLDNFTNKYDQNERTLYLLAERNIYMFNNNEFRDEPQKIKAYLYTNQKLALYGVASHVELHGGVYGKQAVILNATKGKTRNVGGGNPEPEADQLSLSPEQSRLRIVFDPDMILLPPKGLESVFSPGVYSPGQLTFQTLTTEIVR